MGWDVALILAATLGVAGVLMVVLGRKQANGTLGRNSLAGYRTNATMASDAAWNAAHSATAGYTISAGVVSLIGAAVMLTNPSNIVGAVVALATAVLIVGIVLAGGRVAQRAAKRVDAHG